MIPASVATAERRFFLMKKTENVSTEYNRYILVYKSMASGPCLFVDTV